MSFFSFHLNTKQQQIKVKTKQKLSFIFSPNFLGMSDFFLPIFSNQEFSTNFQHEKLEEITKKLEEITFFKKKLVFDLLGFPHKSKSCQIPLNSFFNLFLRLKSAEHSHS